MSITRHELTYADEHGVISSTRTDWCDLALEFIADTGYAIITDVLDDKFIEETRSALYRVQSAIEQQIGKERLLNAGELGVLRLMMKYDEHFYRFLEIPEMLAAIDRTVSKTAILHVQNGFILPSYIGDATPSVFQNNFHMDFNRVLNGYLLSSLNAMFAIDAFDKNNGATLIVPGSHQRMVPPSIGYMNTAAIPLVCEAGSMILFDSTLWHSAGRNTSNHDRLAVNHQFTRAFFKQQIDYPEALPSNVVKHFPDRTQQLLGYYTRVPAQLDEYYVPEHQRLYKAGQG